MAKRVRKPKNPADEPMQTGRPATREDRRADFVVSEVVLVTPTVAMAWLQKNKQNNRPLSDRFVDFLAAEMKAGRWVLNGDAVVFDETGDLMDGQHRLAACVRSNTAISMLVVEGVSRNAFYTKDQGRKRSVSDIAHTVGIAGAQCPNVGPSAGDFAIVRAMMYSGRQNLNVLKSVPATTLIDFFVKHRTAIVFAWTHLPVKAMYGNFAPVRAVVARAFYTKDRGDLMEFCKAIREGVVSTNGRDNSSIQVFIRYMRETLMNAGAGSRAVREEMFLKTENALDHYLRGKPLKSLKARYDSKEVFPIPDNPLEA